jgi:serine/threonine-protein kinase
MSLERLSAALADRYRIDRELGRGGMATVYLAEDVRHRRRVALKVLHPELSAVLGPDRFLKEIELTASLQHPHILPLFDSGNAAGQLFYVMPFVEGETLRARLEREKQLPIEDALRIAREVADALQYAHDRAVIHRDIKPENILLQGGHALVADFGIALAVQQAGGTRMTQTGLSLGTPHYMSPEQAMGERTIDARSDVYALGAVTYEMLVGEPPFTGVTVQQIVARVMSEDPRALVTQRKAIPAQVEAAVLRALEKLPADRFASAEEFGASLDARATGATRLSTSRAAATGSRTALYTLGGIAAVSLVAAAWAWMRPDPAPPEVIRYRIVIDSVPAARDWRGDLAISPDGSVIARAGGPKGTILLRRRDELEFTPLDGSEDAAAPFFSADGTRVGFTASSRLLTMPLGGGPATVIADSQPTLDGVVWARDGYLYRNARKDGLWIIGRSQPRAGAAIEPVTVLDTARGELNHTLAELLPDGKAIVFTVAFVNGDRKIAVSELGTRTHTILVDGARARYAPSGHLVYATMDGKLWAAAFDLRNRTLSGDAKQVADHIPASIGGPVDFVIAADGTLAYSVEDAEAGRELAWLDRTGRRSSVDSTWKGQFVSPTLSRDGTRIVVAVQDGQQTHLWIKPTAGGPATRLTFQHRSNYEPAWSPDGRWVSYLTGQGASNTGDVWRQPSDGGGRAERILRSERPLSEQVWMPGSNALVVRTTTPTAGAGDILFMAAGDSVAKPLVASAHSEYSPAASPDGQWIAYASNESGRSEIYVIPASGSAASKWPISNGGGITPRWSPRGDEIFYLDLRSNLMAARVVTRPAFAVQDTRLLFNAGDFVFNTISRRNYDVSPDGQRFLMVQRAAGAKSGVVVVVEHAFNRKVP